MSHQPPKPECICSRGATDIPEVPLWRCPCQDCTHLEWEINHDNGDTNLTLREWREENWPEHYPHPWR